MTEPVEKNIQHVLVGEREKTTYEIIEMCITSSFDDECVRLLSSEDKKSADHVLTFYITKDLSFILQANSIQDIAESVFSHSQLFKFVFNVTERSVANLLLNKIVLEDLYLTVQQAALIDKTKDSISLCLTPRPILESISLDTLTVYNIIRNNRWVMILYFCILFISKTQTYKAILGKLNNQP